MGGELKISATDISNHYKFTGKERDSESGLDYFGARYYGNALGRFLSPDIGGLQPSNPQSLNRYAYVSDNPLAYVDPDGDQSVPITLGRVSVTRWMHSRKGEELDKAQLLPSFGSVRFRPYNKSVARQQSPHEEEVAHHNDPMPNVGGCVMGCYIKWLKTPFEWRIEVSFEQTNKDEEIVVSVEENLDVGFISPYPPEARIEHTWLPGGLGFPPDIDHVDIYKSAIHGLSDKQLDGLGNWARRYYGDDPRQSQIIMAIWQAVMEEQVERAKRKEEEKKKRDQHGKRETHGRNDVN